MKDKNRRIEEILIVGTVLLLLALTMLVFQKTLPSSFQEITGAVLTRVNVSLPLGAYCNFSLYSGLNLVSFFCLTTNDAVMHVFGNMSNLEAVFEYQELNSSDSWKIYNPNLPSFVIQDLQYVSRLEGYWVEMSANENFLFEGGLRLPSSIILTPGWNLAGYPTNQTKDVNTSFQSIDNNFTEVRAYNALGANFFSYVPGVGGSLNQTEPYSGYWINSTVSEVWIVD